MTNIESIHAREADRPADLPGLSELSACGVENEDVHWIPVADLVLSDSPRTGGEDSAHTRVLAESDVELPPIIVQRRTYRVVDGMHRVRAAQIRGERDIRARFFDGDDESAFALAVRLNVRHGLPLSLADRKKAAARILHEHPAWSNRAIASVAGLSAKTVAALREKSGQPGGQSRIGRDGRVRPLSTVSGRERAKEILTREPGSSLRAVSAIAGVSPGTVRAVRDQLRRQSGAVIPAPRQQTSQHGPMGNPDVMLRALRADPSLRFTQSGRRLLSILEVAAMETGAHERLIADLPDHCVGLVAELAAASVRSWRDIAMRLDQRRSRSA